MLVWAYSTLRINANTSFLSPHLWVDAIPNLGACTAQERCDDCHPPRLPLNPSRHGDSRCDLLRGLEGRNGQPLLPAVSLGFVHNVAACHQQLGRVTNPDTPGLRGQPQVLDAIDRLFLQELIEADPSIYSDELQHKLAIACGVHVSIATINRTLSPMVLTRKTMPRYASEWNDSVRVLWELQVAQPTDPNIFVFLDESAVDVQTGLRANGWLPANLPAVETCSFEASIIPSSPPNITGDDLEILGGSITKDRFHLNFA